MTDIDTRHPASATLRSSGNASDPAVSWKVKCLNCGAALAGPFCAECGQRAVPPHPTVSELAGDVFQEVSGWDGKFADTIRTLMRRPGELTRQWIEGRRIHFISPLRLYLTASLLYFVVTAAAPKGAFDARKITVGGVDVSRTAPQSRPGRVAEQTEKALQSGTALTGAERDSVLADIAAAPWLMRPLMRKAVDEPNAIRTGMLQWMPRMLFALLPMYAGILALFHRRRHYPEHLYFAIHLHAFVFVALMLSDLFKFTRVGAISAIASAGVMLWIVVYAILALKRVYGGSLGITLAKGVGIMTLYGVIAMPMLLAAVILSAWL